MRPCISIAGQSGIIYFAALMRRFPSGLIGAMLVSTVLVLLLVPIIGVAEAGKKDGP